MCDCFCVLVYVCLSRHGGVILGLSIGKCMALVFKVGSWDLQGPSRGLPQQKEKRVIFCLIVRCRNVSVFVCVCGFVDVVYSAMQDCRCV